MGPSACFISVVSIRHTLRNLIAHIPNFLTDGEVHTTYRRLNVRIRSSEIFRGSATMARTGIPRVVITGLGVVSPIGVGKDAFWRSLADGRSGIDYLQSVPSENLPSKLAGEVRNFDPVDHVYHKKFIKVMSRDIQLGVSAASIAMRDSGITGSDVDPLRMGVEFGAGRISSTPEELVDAVSDLELGDDITEFTRWGEDRMGRICPLWLLKQLPNMPACHVAIAHNAQGPNNTITSREASALLCLAEATRTIERGAADVMIVGSCSSMTDPLDIARLNLFESLSRREDDPHRACRPFDRDRDGSVVGEGSAVFVLEEYEHARRRGADIYAELLGVGSGCDGRDINLGGGAGLVRSIQAALRRSAIRPDEIGHINAHGKSTQRDDMVESRAFHKSLGSHAAKIPVTALTSYFGNFDAGTGSVELAGSLLALRNRELPITLNYEYPDPDCPINVVSRQTMPLNNSVALSVNRTSIGQSAACVLRAI